MFPGVPSDATGVGRMARDLSAFFKIANVINSTRDVQALQRELLVLISEVIPAAEAAIVLQPSRNDLPRPLVYLEQEGTGADGDDHSGRTGAAGDLGTLRCLFRGLGLDASRPSMCCVCPWWRWRESWE